MEILYGSGRWSFSGSLSLWLLWLGALWEELFFPPSSSNITAFGPSGLFPLFWPSFSLIGRFNMFEGISSHIQIVWSIEAGTKVLASKFSLDYRARRSGGVGSTTLISSAFTALLNCAEVGRRNRILTNYRFLSHSLLIGNICWILLMASWVVIKGCSVVNT